MPGDGVGFLPVVAGERLMGSLTDRDIVLRRVAEGPDPASTTAREVMSVEVIRCFSHDDE